MKDVGRDEPRQSQSHTVQVKGAGGAVGKRGRFKVSKGPPAVGTRRCWTKARGVE